MRVLVLNPPFLPRYSRASRVPAVARSGTLYYPIWLAYAVGSLERRGHDVLFLDAPAAGLTCDAVLRCAGRFGARLAVLDTSTASIENDCATAARLKRSIPGLLTVLVGAHVSALPAEVLLGHESVDAIACREYDATVADLASRLSEGGGDRVLASVPGLVFRRSDGRIERTPDRPLIEDLDELPFVSAVYKKHLAPESYFYAHSRHPLVVTVTGRGCPFHCTYCVLPQVMYGHRYRTRSIANVVAEFKYIARNFPSAKEIMLEDDTLTADRSRTRALARSLVTSGAATIPWSANARPDIDRETMRLMRRAGCRLLCVGIESGSQVVLDAIRKGTRVEQIRRFARDARAVGIKVHGCFMLGNRGDTRDSCLQTIRFARDLEPDTAQFYPVIAFPGTDDYRYFRAQDRLATDDFRQWLTPDGRHTTVVRGSELTPADLVELCARARRRFYLRPRYLVGRAYEVIRHPGETKRLFAAWRTFAAHLAPPGRTPDQR